MNKDTEIKRTLNNNPFLTPEGYFDTLTDRIMARIPADSDVESITTPAPTIEPRKPKARIISLFNLHGNMRWAAACAVTLAFTATLVLMNNNKENMANNNAEMYEEMMDAADYGMMDSQDVYNILADEME